jgi:hypothetical protein
MANDSAGPPVVVGADGSPVSRAAPRWAVQEAARRHCPVERTSEESPAGQAGVVL